MFTINVIAAALLGLAIAYAGVQVLDLLADWLAKRSTKRATR